MTNEKNVLSVSCLASRSVLYLHGFMHKKVSTKRYWGPWIEHDSYDGKDRFRLRKYE